MPVNTAEVVACFAVVRVVVRVVVGSGGGEEGAESVPALVTCSTCVLTSLAVW